MMATSASSPAIVDCDNCHLLKNTEKPFILAIKLGENLFQSILRCADSINLKSASITGLGAVCNVTVAYYHLLNKTYESKLFEGMYELISMNGNISFVDGKRFVHLHAALGKPNYEVVGGHIMDATVGASAEIAITPLSGVITRQLDAETGLKLMCPIPSAGQDVLR